MGNFVGGFVAYAILRQGAALTYICGISGLLFLLLVPFALPKMLKCNEQQITGHQSQNAALSVSKIRQRVLSSLKTSVRSLRSVLLDDPRLRIAFLVWTFAATGSYTSSIFLQYIAK